jgi:RNA polymerase sigma-70 factor (ECF subfamily)
MSTLWTMVHCAAGDQSGVFARQELCRRYHGAAERFLRIAMRDDRAAAELAQEFAVKVLRGDLAGADENAGRFRDFVKGVLRHLIADHYRRRGRAREVQAGDDAPEPCAPEDNPATLDREWIRSWRQELLNRAWASLADWQARNGTPFHDVLRFRSDNPEMRSHELAAPLGEKLGKPVTAAWVRQMIHRARERFGELLLEEIADTISDPGVEALEDELAELELLQYCQGALEKWRDRPAGR